MSVHRHRVLRQMPPLWWWHRVARQFLDVVFPWLASSFSRRLSTGTWSMTLTNVYVYEQSNGWRHFVLQGRIWLWGNRRGKARIFAPEAATCHQEQLTVIKIHTMITAAALTHLKMVTDFLGGPLISQGSLSSAESIWRTEEIAAVRSYDNYCCSMMPKHWSVVFGNDDPPGWPLILIDSGKLKKDRWWSHSTSSLWVHVLCWHFSSVYN